MAEMFSNSCLPGMMRTFPTYHRCVDLRHFLRVFEAVQKQPWICAVPSVSIFESQGIFFVFETKSKAGFLLAICSCTEL